MRYETLDALCAGIATRLAEAGYDPSYRSESAFEAAVWSRLMAFMSEAEQDPRASCLTSHVEREDRSAEAWEAFLREDPGPDVNVFGTNNRLDIVVKHASLGSIGVEVKCLGEGEVRHPEKLIHGIGQAMLALANRERTFLVIHCGTIDNQERLGLREIADRICRGTRLSIVAVP
jgi:hypothetical protein